MFIGFREVCSFLKIMLHCSNFLRMFFLIYFDGTSKLFLVVSGHSASPAKSAMKTKNTV